MLKTISASIVKGIQKIGGLWRIYLSDQPSRIELISNGLHIRNASIAVFDTNPFLHANNENHIRVLIKDIPLSVHDNTILTEFQNRKLKVSGKLILQRLRVDGKLTECLTGDRVLYVEKPTQPLPRFMSFGYFKARVFHPDQIAIDNSNTVCTNCLLKGHHRSSCKNQTKCRFCGGEGHLQRDCTATTSESNTIPSLYGPDREETEHISITTAPAKPRDLPSTSSQQQRMITHFLRQEREAAPKESAVRRSESHSSSDDDSNDGDDESEPSKPTRDRESSDTQSKSQAKITRFMPNCSSQRDAADTALLNNDTNSQPETTNALSHSEASTRDQVNTDHSDISAESPEVVRTRLRSGSVSLPKRKQRGTRKQPKKK